ncbi:MAG: hypothetical protein HY673_11655 [Chloroflexi bacterium]|nr:hypothetical protein [Chloroflexota bacterium]
MLEIKKTAIFLEAEEVEALERIIVDWNKETAIDYLKKFIYDRVSRYQRSL